MSKNHVTTRQRNYALDVMRDAANKKRMDLRKQQSELTPQLTDEELVARLTKAGFEVNTNNAMYYARHLRSAPTAAVKKKINEITARIAAVDAAAYGENLMKDFADIINVQAWFPTGSRVICNPPVLDTDEDFVLLVDSYTNVQTKLEALGYVKSNNAHYRDVDEPMIDTYRRPHDNVNLIVTDKMNDYTKWRVAHCLAKEFNLRDKVHRTMLFRAIRSGGMKIDTYNEVQLKQQKADRLKAGRVNPLPLDARRLATAEAQLLQRAQPIPDLAAAVRAQARDLELLVEKGLHKDKGYNGVKVVGYFVDDPLGEEI